MANSSFGNPETKAFDRQFLRWATHGEVKIRVHQKVWPLVSRILIGLDQSGIDITGASSNDDDPLRLSFKLVVPPSDAEKVELLVSPASFEYRDGVIRFTGTAERADELSALIGVQADQIMDEDVSSEPSEPPAPSPEKIGGPVKLGDEGITVTFIQHIVGAPVTGIFDTATEDALKRWQKKHWAEPDGVANEATWDSLLVTRGAWLRPGATGNQVKVLQAAFLTLGFQNSKITGVWGTRFSHSLRLLQTAYRLPLRARVSQIEWTAIFDPYQGMDEQADELSEVTEVV